MTRSAEDEMHLRYERYEAWATVPLLANGFVYAGSFIAILTDPGDTVAQWVFWFSWALFVADYLICIYLHPRRWRYILTHPLILVALVFPPLRLYLLFLVLERAFRNKNSPLRDKIGLMALYITMINIVFGSYLVWRFEHGAPGADIHTYGESLWWAVASVTTVGYGDYVPVTVAGRVTATVMLFSGVASIAVFTGVLVGYLSADARRARRTRNEPPATPDVDPATDHTVDLAAVERRLAAIERALTIGHPDATSPGGSDPDTRLTSTAGRPSERQDGRTPTQTRPPTQTGSDDDHDLAADHGPGPGSPEQ
ncbi:MAG: potassium channel family protein [Candidatus Nanopelagicales bacterium]